MSDAGYTGGTESMQADPEARHPGGGASVSISGGGGRGLCADSAEEWVPDRELPVVPDAMAGLCQACPRQQCCLQEAVAGRHAGYWAGSTSADREVMRQWGWVDRSAVAVLQQAARDRLRAAQSPALHTVGQGSQRWYRRGCRCGQCRAAHAATRARERARKRAPATA